MSSSSSSSSSGNGGNGNGSGRGNGSGGNYGAGGGEYEGPSRSRPRAINEVWPEPFLEALAAQVAIDASRIFGRLAAAQALANVFQVSSTWRAVSRSDLLWHRLARCIWGRTQLLHDSWREEYIYRHRTARNFPTVHHPILFFTSILLMSRTQTIPTLSCLCLALSDHHLACGFADGAVRLFDLHTRLHRRTYLPQHRDRLGRFSRAVSGIIINDAHLVFATLDGDIHVAIIHSNEAPRRVHFGDVVRDGVLVDFTVVGNGGWASMLEFRAGHFTYGIATPRNSSTLAGC
ncbi:hypothetical protein GH714_022780 [Hevea brasiliensis]|uniref:F-box domain-containing protein n=1 Tax=Hevea brasiliensis TaxID=3981 RepID=A0A6A6KWV0_HEVBR|nr:hypothetical protein GH714_022780 [Hevea brasiliensis]